MLSQHLQEQLAQKYGGPLVKSMVKKAFDRELTKALKTTFEEDTEGYSVLLFVDISRFSDKTSGFTAKEMRNYLDGYYSQVIPTIYNCSGMIDRIAGDGILAIFSPILSPSLVAKSCEEQALKCAESILSSVSQTKYESKAAISGGVYCSVEQAWQAFTKTLQLLASR